MSDEFKNWRNTDYIKAHAILAEQIELAIIDLESSQTIPIAWVGAKIDQVIMRLREAQNRSSQAIEKVACE